MAAEILSSKGLHTVVFERMPSVGRKFLLAGRGGLNLTHSEPLEEFLSRYRCTVSNDGPSFADAIRAFPPEALREWSAGLGHDTFVGTSGRVFPRELRANPLLGSWLERLEGQGVEIRTRSRFLGWSGDRLLIQHGEDEPCEFAADVTVLAFGGASWPAVGSDGRWQELLREQGVRVTELTPSNCGFTHDWSGVFLDRFEGKPVKNIRVSAGGLASQSELMVVDSGIEGGAVYAVGAELRRQLDANGRAELVIDLLPGLDTSQIVERLSRRRPKESTARALKRLLGLDPVKIGLLHEAALTKGGTPALPTTSEPLAQLVKSLPFELSGSEGLERAISSDGGVDLTELDANFMLKAVPSTFCAGEMLHWDAPTGGYLLQATFATAVAAAEGALRWIGADLRDGSTAR